MAELPDAVMAWAAKPGPVKFLAVLRRHLEQEGKAQGMLSFSKNPLTTEERLQLSELFGNSSKIMSAERVNLRMVREHLGKLDLTLEEVVEGTLGLIPTWKEAKHHRDTVKRMEVARRRLDLLAVMQGVSLLEDECKLLLDLPVEPAFQVPSGTRTRAGKWPPYETAIRAAVAWWACYEWEQGPVPEGTLCATAFGEAKSKRRLGGAARLAFQNLIRKNYDEAVESAETCIRLSGPLVWQLDQVMADAAIASPWIGVPSRSIRGLGRCEGDPEGILLVENQETFEQICRKTSVNDRWLCIWNEGYAGKDLIEFIKLYRHLPVAACCDLDPDGIGIIENLIAESGIDVHPVGMNAEIWRRTPKRREKKPETQPKTKVQAQGLKDKCHVTLRPLAAAIAETGERVEQEQLVFFQELIRVIPEQLDSLGG